jgi:hypothetical protein
VQPDDEVDDRRVDQEGQQKSSQAVQTLVEGRTFEPQEKGDDDRGRGRQQIVQDNQNLTRRKSWYFHVASFRVKFFTLPTE